MVGRAVDVYEELYPIIIETNETVRDAIT